MAKEPAQALPAKIDPAHQVYQWIVAGHTEHDILEAIQTKWPGTEAKPLIVKAVTALKQAGTPDPETLRGWCLEAKRELYKKMVEIGDFAGALTAIKEIEKAGKT